MTVPAQEAPANYVPAAAVIRREQALSGIIGCKECVDGKLSWSVKSLGSTEELQPKLVFLSAGEERGIPSVAVKCVDIRRNTSGEGGLLDDN